MSRLSKILVFILLMTFFVCIYMLWAVKPNFLTNNYYSLSISLGEDIHETQIHSTYDLSIDKHEPRTTDIFAVERTPTIFEYRDSKLGFVLPPTILVTIGTENSKVKNIETYPQLKLLNLNDSKILLKKMIKLFDEKGWQRNSIYEALDPDTLRADDFENKHAHIIVVGAWINRDTNLLLSIKRRIKKSDLEAHPKVYSYYAKKPYQDYFLVEVALLLK